MSVVPERPTLVVVPTYQERENLPRLVPMILQEGEGLHVLVVDDSSPDGTGDVADDLAVRWPDRVFVLHRGGKGGLGPAYLAGFRWALGHDYGQICQMDADLSHPPGMLPVLLAALDDEGVDFVIGSRYLEGHVTVVNWPLSRLLISLFGNAYARAITRLPVSDVTGGFNLFRRSVLEGVALDRIQSTGYTFQIELKLRAWRNGFRFVEVPIIFTERDHGESKMSKLIILEAVWKVWKLRILDMVGRL